MNTLDFNKTAAGTPAAVTLQKLINRIRHWRTRANLEDVERGMHWYAQAHEFCRVVADECGFKLADVAQVVAILSPQVDWEANKRNAVLLCTTLDAGIKIFADKGQKLKALAALSGDYQIPETAWKTFSFADNIANPESLRVTVDRHAWKVALNDLETGDFVITEPRYRLIEQAYQTVAREHGIMPYQLQAIAWVTYKRIVGR